MPGQDHAYMQADAADRRAALTAATDLFGSLVDGMTPERHREWLDFADYAYVWLRGRDSLCPGCRGGFLMDVVTNTPRPGETPEQIAARTAPRTIPRQTADKVDHPPHYNAHPSGIECIAVTEHMNFNLGNAVKYIWRAGLKSPDAVVDLEKARWYLDREIANEEAER